MSELLHSLRNHTPARVAIGRHGTGLPTSEILDFRLAHAQARDAVLQPVAFDKLAAALSTLGVSSLTIQSAAPDRGTYVARPDLGRKLSDLGIRDLQAIAHNLGYAHNPPDLALVVCDGLSGSAIDSWALDVIRLFGGLARSHQWSTTPAVLVQNGRVAIGDHIGEILSARMTVLLVGERPGLGSADSLGVYLTHSPRAGTTDEARNCISNIRGTGLPPVAAAHKMAWLIEESLRRGLSGTGLKDESPVYSLVS